jgi:hypothetical protein
MSRRLGLWITVLALPLAALGLLVAEPDLDLRWEHHPSHFWLVLTVSGVNVALGLFASEAAARRDDDRTFLVSMALLASAGFLGLHALATPGVLLDHSTAGFSVAARVGLLLAAGFAAVSALGSDTQVVRVLARHRRRVRAVLAVLLAAWAIASLARVPLLDRPLPPDTVPPPLGLLALAGVALYGIAAFRYAELYRRRRRPLPLAVLVAFVLLAEAMIAAVFAGIYLDRTLRRIDRHEAERLSAVVDAIRSGGPVDQILARFRQEGMSREEADVLERSARELSRVDALFHLYVAPQLGRDHRGLQRVTKQPDHAMRAARAALAIRSEADRLAADHSSWPRSGSRSAPARRWSGRSAPTCSAASR